MCTDVVCVCLLLYIPYLWYVSNDMGMLRQIESLKIVFFSSFAKSMRLILSRSHVSQEIRLVRQHTKYTYINKLITALIIYGDWYVSPNHSRSTHTHIHIQTDALSQWICAQKFIYSRAQIIHFYRKLWWRCCWTNAF